MLSSHPYLCVTFKPPGSIPPVWTNGHS